MAPDLFVNKYRRQYYEQAAVWNVPDIQMSAEMKRIEEVMTSVPLDVKSILDVGCGKGLFVNALINNQLYKSVRVVGLDISRKALEYVKAEKSIGTVTDLPFESDSFDLVSCLELLEHLPSDDFERGIKELERISRNYIIITVPNEQNLELALTKCPECHCRFNPYLHVRSFNRDVLRTLFASSTPLRIDEIGPIVYSLSPAMNTIHKIFKNANSYTTICPQCGFKTKQNPQDRSMSDHERSMLSRVSLFCRKAIREMITLKRRKWLLGLYEKK